MSGIDYAEKYKCLKRKIKILVYEQEVLTTELEKLQTNLLKVSQDNSFLLDNLLQHEHVALSSPVDSDATVSSDSEFDYTPPPKKRAPQSSAKQVKTENVEIETGVTYPEKATLNESLKTEEITELTKIENPIIVSDEPEKEPS